MIRRRRKWLLSELGISPTKLTFRDLLLEATATVTRRPGRAAITALGTALGVAAFVATLGLAATVSHQVSSRFDALRSTEVVLVDARPEDSEPAFPPDISARLRRLNGVVAAGETWVLADQVAVRSVSGDNGLVGKGEPLRLVAASPGALEAMRPHVESGLVYNQFHESRGEMVAVLGRGAAQRLGVTAVADQPAVFIGQEVFTVTAVVTDLERRPELSMAVIVPNAAARRLTQYSGAAHEVLIETVSGAAHVVGEQAALAARANDPGRYAVSVPPDPRSLRRGVEGDVSSLLLLLAALSLAIGVVGIMNTTLVSVLERVPELGLRRALGGTPRHIAAQILSETGALGTVGGLMGVAVGLLVVTSVSAAKGWTAVLDLRLVFVAPAVGMASGLLAGVVPARMASRIEPVEALRR